MKIGWYYSPMDWRNPDCRSAKNAEFVKRMQAELTELLGNYGMIGSAVIEQAYPELKRIRRFAIEYKYGNEWMVCCHGENPGARLDFKFDPVSARHVRLNVIESTDGPTISEFQLYQPVTGK